MSEQQYLTSNGAEELRKELARLKGPERDAMAQRLRAAIQQGDLSENADYHKAKEDQGFLEGRIQELEYVLDKAIVVDDQLGKHDTVQVGARVTIQEAGEEPETYLLVGAKEARPSEGKISNESPIGSALMGKREGDTVTASTPGGELRIKILKVE